MVGLAVDKGQRRWTSRQGTALGTPEAERIAWVRTRKGIKEECRL